MQRNCLVENNCYIIDFFDIVRRVNSDNPEDWIEYEGNTFRQPVLRGEKKVGNYLSDVGRMMTDRINPMRPYILRGDGVHLTSYGEASIADAIKEALEANSPACNY